MNHTRTMLKGTLILTLSGFLTKIIGFFYRIFLSQTIGSTVMGIYQLIFPIHALCFALTVGGIQTAISRLVAAKFAKKEDSDARAVFLIATSFSTLLSILVTFFLFHYADWFAIHILFEPQCTSLLKVSSLSIPMGTFHSCVNGYYFARKKTLLPALSQLIEQTARVAASYLPCLESGRTRNHSYACCLWSFFWGIYFHAVRLIYYHHGFSLLHSACSQDNQTLSAVKRNSGFFYTPYL